MPMRATVLPQPEPGHAILRVSDLDAPADGLALSLQRQQGPDSHLADDGWRRTEAWLVPAFVERVSGALEFHLGPEICDRLAGTALAALETRQVTAFRQQATVGGDHPKVQQEPRREFNGREGLARHGHPGDPGRRRRDRLEKIRMTDLIELG